MRTTKDTVWQRFPPLALPSPVLALALGAGGIWVGGAGGVAWRDAGGEWEPRISGLPLLTVTALEYVSGQLVAGGTGGIARSQDGGKTWQKANLQEGVASITAFATSPNFAQDHTMLAATLESGILRTEDDGLNWHTVTFGLQSFEVIALLWAAGETVIAATVDGLYRSSNGGRAWRFVRESEGLSLAALALQPDGTLLAASESGEMLRSTDNGTRWQPFGKLPAETQSTALWVTPSGTLLLGTTSHGLLRSSSNGTTWEEVLQETQPETSKVEPLARKTVLSFAANGKILYAGTSSDISVSVDDGITWRMLPYPPIHDLRRLVLLNDNLFVAGMHAGLLRSTAQDWQPLADLPYPVTGITVTPDGALLLSSLSSLHRSEDNGESWHTVIPGEPGNLAHFAFRPDGTGCAGSADGTYLFRTQDHGKTWQQLQSPFGILPLAALLLTADAFIAVNYDPRQYNAHIWRSLDSGTTWTREVEAQTTWPLVTTYASPALITLADTILLEEPSGKWKQIVPQSGAALRRIVGSDGTLFALSTAGLHRSADSGTTWTRDDTDLPTDEILDIGLHNSTLYLLLTDGRVWSRDV